jgi:hypothetical protein
MAVTNRLSDVYTIQVATAPGARNERDVFGSESLWIYAEVTQTAAAGDANSTLELGKVPSGSRLLLVNSILNWSAFGASRVLSIGYRAYTKADGTTQAESLTALGTALDVSSAGVNVRMNTLTSPIHTYLFEGDAVLVLQCTGGTIPQNAVVRALLHCLRR